MSGAVNSLRLLINGREVAGELEQVTENRPLVIRAEPLDSAMPLAAITLRIAGTVEEGAIPPARPGGVEWRYTPAQAAGLLPLLISAPGMQLRLHLPVVPAKLTLDEYTFLLADLRRVAHGIVYTLYAPTHRGLRRHPPAANAAARLLERFQFLADSGAVERVLKLVRLLGHHHVITADAVRLPRERVRRLPAASLFAIAERPDGRHALALVKQATPDCYENRVVKLLLLALRRLTRTLAQAAAPLLAARTEERPLAPGVRERLTEVERSCTGWQRQLEQVLVLDPWPAVGTTAAVDRPSTVFVMHPVYRELLHWYRRLQDIWEATVDSPAFTLPLRSLPELYEIWCFARVVGALQRGLGSAGRDASFIRLRDSGFELALASGGDSCIRFDAGSRRLRVHYNKQYLGITGLRYYPDITLEVEGPSGPEGLVVLDAKYRRNAEDDGPSYKQDDIDKMHTYRDALRWHGQRVRSAFILYPGDEAAIWGGGVIGAVPMRPSPQQRETALEQALGVALGNFGISWEGQG